MLSYLLSYSLASALRAVVVVVVVLLYPRFNALSAEVSRTIGALDRVLHEPVANLTGKFVANLLVCNQVRIYLLALFCQGVQNFLCVVDKFVDLLLIKHKFCVRLLLRLF